ncbi:MAG: SoxR reducing system RseC family protein [Clostridia bacterium]
MLETGEVIEVNGKIARIKFKRGKMCGKCHACMSLSSDELAVELDNTLDAHVGDFVNISLHEKSIVKAGLIMYGIPLVMLILGAYLGSLIGDLYAAAFGAIFAFSSYFILRLFEKRFKKMDEFNPKMISFKNDDKD